MTDFFLFHYVIMFAFCNIKNLSLIPLEIHRKSTIYILNSFQFYKFINYFCYFKMNQNIPQDQELPPQNPTANEEIITNEKDENQVVDETVISSETENISNDADDDFRQQISEFETQLAAANQEIAKLKDGFLRAKAEVENVRRIAGEENLKAKKFAVENFAKDLLAAKDSLEAALNTKEQTIENFYNGVDLILKQLNAAFEKNNLLEVNPINQEKFNPNYHQAIQMVPSAEVAKDCVISVLQKGYLIADRVLRPAMVIVSAGNPEGTSQEPNQQN